MIYYLERGKTVTDAFYAELIRKLRIAIKKNHRRKLRQGALLHHDNAPGPAHTPTVAKAAIHECGSELLHNPP